MATQTTNYGLTLPNYDEMADIDVINENMDLIDAQMKKNADGVGQAKSIVSDAYSGSSTYNVGDYCIYDNKLYRCITAVTKAEAFDSAKWKETSVKSELSTLNSNINNVKSFNLTDIKWIGSSTFIKVGKIAVISMDGYTSNDWSHGSVIAKLPSDCLPCKTTYATFLSNNDSHQSFLVAVTPDGNVHSMLTGGTSAGTTIFGSLTWIKGSIVYMCS